MLQKCYQRRLIPLAFGALVLENELQCLAVCINSTNDASISCENFVKFGPVTPELNVTYDMAKKLAYFVEYLRINWTDFRSALRADDTSEPYLHIFRFVKGRCHGNQIMLP